jgi:hypothetical protein
MRRRALLLLIGATMPGCDDTTLAGSLSSLFPLDVSAELVQRNQEAFRYSFSD